TTWTPLLDEFGGLSIGALAHHPTQADVLLAGTGEANASGDSYDGIGMLRTTDGGDSWEVIGLESSQRIGRIAWDATDPDVIHAAVSGGLFSAGPDRGMYRSTDGGDSWHQTFFLSDTTSAIDVVVDPVDGDNVYCAMWDRLRGPGFRNVAGPNSGIWRSTDGGDSWARMTSGVPTGDDVARIGLAVAPSSPSTLYAVFSRYSSSSGTFMDGVYRSTNSGSTWSQVTGTSLGNPYSSFGWYFGQIRVSPGDANTAFVLGVDLKRSTNGGANWSTVTGTQHVDFHDVWIDPSDPSRVLSGNDGGVYRSSNGGSGWTKCPDLRISQFYAITVDPQLPQRIYGGTQDNSTLRTLTGALDDWDVLIGGDGFTTVVDPTDSDIIYGEAQNGWLTKSTDGWNFSTILYLGGSERTNWHMPVRMDPTDRLTLYCGSYRVYRTTNGGGSWSVISPDLTDGPGSGNLTIGTLTTLDVAPSDPATIWAGSDDGNVHVSTNGGSTWSEVDAGLPSRYVTRVTADHTDDSVAYVALSGFTLDEPQPHVFRTTDHGASWTDVSGNLPDAPVNDVIVDPEDGDRLFVATDVGVFVTNDLGGTWTKIGVDLPLCVIVDLELHPGTRTLVAGTHGRSAFTLDLAAAVDAPAVAGVREDGLRLDAPRPNPSRGTAALVYSLPADSHVRLEIHDAGGRRVATVVDGRRPAGRHRATWDGRDSAGTPVAAGVYFARLSTGDRTRT
ncbi:MAG TPA: FlgD immunoglobulin-like domain containing protein, partial [bacterium]|nr:FlgD immunoglobulin-like domain containing protein [bacterium]